MLHIGTDEAGYGPLLGPLVIAASAFRTDAPRASLADPAVKDSKVLHARGGRNALARALAPYVDAPRPLSLSRLLAGCAIGGDPRAGHPWYGDVTDAAPPDRSPHPSFLRLYLNPVCERQFNEGCGGPGGKASLLTRETLRLVRRALEDHPGEPAEVVCDRHGGRKRYAVPLMESLLPATIVAERETPDRSDYRIVVGGRPVRISFLVRADGADPPAALASVAAKYLRELFMQALNEYFAERVRGLRPTAGYYEDGRRFVAEVESLLDTLDGGRRAFVRER